MKRPQKAELILPCVYTQDELDAKRDRLSAAILEYDKVEAEKKEVSSTYTDTLKALRGEMRVLSTSINRKGDERKVECLVTFHQPDIGYKTTVRTDTGEVVKTETMTDDERQGNLFEETEALERMYGAPDLREAQDIQAPPSPSDDATGYTSDPDEAGA